MASASDMYILGRDLMWSGHISTATWSARQRSVLLIWSMLKKINIIPLMIDNVPSRNHEHIHAMMANPAFYDGFWIAGCGSGSLLMRVAERDMAFHQRDE